MKTIVFCLCLLAMGVWPADVQAQDRENPWAISLSVGYGYDFEQLSRKYNNPAPLIIDGSGYQTRLQLGDPLVLQLGGTVPFGDRIGLETGFGMSFRSIRYWSQLQGSGEEDCSYCRAKLSVFLFRVPLMLDLIPFSDPEGGWRLHLKTGLAFDWSGINDVLRNGPASLERPYKVEVVDLSKSDTYMFQVFDDELSVSLLAGMEWEKSLGRIGRLGWGLTFSRQMNTSTSLLIWGYDREQGIRTGGYFPNNLQFVSLVFNVRYVYDLPL